MHLGTPAGRQLLLHDLLCALLDAMHQPGVSHPQLLKVNGMQPAVWAPPLRLQLLALCLLQRTIYHACILSTENLPVSLAADYLKSRLQRIDRSLQRRLKDSFWRIEILVFHNKDSVQILSSLLCLQRLAMCLTLICRHKCHCQTCR